MENPSSLEANVVKIVELVDVNTDQSFSLQRLHQLTSLVCKQVDDADPDDAWNALSLIWQHYENLATSVLSESRPSLEACVGDAAWESLHQVCCSLAGRAAQDEQMVQESNRIRAHLAFHGAKVCPTECPESRARAASVRNLMEEVVL